MGYIGSGVQRFNTADGLTVTGSAEINSLTYPTADGSNGQVLKTNGSGTLSFGTVSTDLVDDTSPQLGGALDVNGNSITSASNGDITIDPNGTGDIVLDANVQIGTTTEGIADYGDTLTIADTGHAGMTIRSGTSSEGNMYFSDGTSGDAEYKGIVKYDHSSNAMSFWSNSLRRATIDSSGNVGIGTSSPSSTLAVETSSIASLSSYAGHIVVGPSSRTSSSGDYSGGILFDQANGVQASGKKGASITGFQDGSDVNSMGITFNVHGTDGSANRFEAMRLDSSGNVGINTATPNEKLTIDSGAISFLGSLSTPSIGAGIFRPANNTLAFVTGSSERMRLTSDGKFRLNATANQVTGYEILTCNGSAGFKSDQTNVVGMWQTSASGHFIQFFGGSGAAGCGNIGFINNNNLLISNDADNSGLQFGSGSITPAYDGAGQNNAVDLGSSSTRFKIGYFNDSLRTRYFVGVDDSNTYIEMGGSDVMKFVAGGAERGRFQSSNGVFQVGKTDASLSTSGSYHQGDGFIGATRSDNPPLGLNRLDGDGDIAIFQRTGNTVGSIGITSSGVTYNTTSDIRLKQDIEPLAATDKLMAMNPVSYNWKADPDGQRSVGFIAQEMQEIMPEAVSTGDDDDAMMSMDYGRITPILVSALQDAHRKIEQLESRIAAMEIGNE